MKYCCYSSCNDFSICGGEKQWTYYESALVKKIRLHIFFLNDFKRGGKQIYLITFLSSFRMAFLIVYFSSNDTRIMYQNHEVWAKKCQHGAVHGMGGRAAPRREILVLSATVWGLIPNSGIFSACFPSFSTHFHSNLFLQKVTSDKNNPNPPNTKILVTRFRNTWNHRLEVVCLVHIVTRPLSLFSKVWNYLKNMLYQILNLY